VLRGILTCAFFGAEAYLPLTLTRLHGGTPRVVGIPLTLAALGWSAGSWWQGRHGRQPIRLMRNGFAVVAVGLVLLILMTARSVDLWFAVPIWAFAGAGMGLAMPTISVRMLELSPEASRGANSAALQISDMVGSIVGIAIAGALVTGLGYGHLSTAIVIADCLLAGVAAIGVLASRRAQ
jgi:predicted MFS family arabinose efflux permease